MMKSRINLRTVIEKAKIGWSLSQISAHFGMNELEFLNALKSTVGESKTREIMDKLEKNIKKKNQPKGCKRAKSHFEKLYSDDEEENINIPVEIIFSPTQEESSTVDDSMISEVTEIEPNVQVVQESGSSISPIDLLEEQISNINKELRELESSREECLSKKIKLKNELIDFREKLRDIENSLVIERGTLVSTAKQMYELSEKATSIYSQIKEKKLTVESLTEKIESLKKVTILVLQDGKIQLESGELVESSDDSREIYNLLILDENLLDFTIREIQQLSIVLHYTNVLKSKGIKYDILFDSSNLEAIFTKLAN